jgi:hypothetical protein
MLCGSCVCSSTINNLSHFFPAFLYSPDETQYLIYYILSLSTILLSFAFFHWNPSSGNIWHAPVPLPAKTTSLTNFEQNLFTVSLQWMRSFAQFGRHTFNEISCVLDDSLFIFPGVKIMCLDVLRILYYFTFLQLIRPTVLSETLGAPLFFPNMSLMVYNARVLHGSRTSAHSQMTAQCFKT